MEKRDEETRKNILEELLNLKRDLDVLKQYVDERVQGEHDTQTFIQKISHLLRTPLTTVRESISQVREGLFGPVLDEQNDYLNSALHELDRLKRILEDYLDLSKIESGIVSLRKEKIDLARLAQKTARQFELYAKQKNLLVTTSFSSEKIEVFADPDRLTQVLTNLLGNAIKFTEEGAIHVSVTELAETVECSVSDTGVGIDEADLPSLFTRFKQVGPSKGAALGTGLGLAISKQFIESHGGQIRAESHEKTGSKFIFTLPKLDISYVLRESVASGLADAIQKETELSLLLFNVTNYDEVLKRVGEAEMAQMTSRLSEVIRGSFRKNVDQALAWDVKRVLAILPRTNRDQALEVGKRIQTLVEKDSEMIKTTSALHIDFHVTNFPTDGRTEEILLKKAFSE